MKTVIIPKGNVPNLADVDDAVRQQLEFVPAENITTVLNTALLNPIQPV